MNAGAIRANQEPAEERRHGEVLGALKRIESLLTPATQPGIRGMVPVAYLKDVIDGFIYRLEAMPILGDAREAMEYARRRRADVEAL